MTRTYSGDSPTELVLSLNVHRRHLTPGQLAAVAVDALPLFEAEARNRQAAAGGAHDRSAPIGAERSEPVRAAEEAAKATGASTRNVQRAKRIKEYSEETFEEVKAGTKTVHAAEREVVPQFKSGVMNKLEKAKANNPGQPDPEDRSPAAAAARVAKAKEMAAQGYTSRQIAPALGISISNFSGFKARHGLVVPADKVTGSTRRHDSDRIVSETASTLEGLVMGIGLADVSELDPEQIDGWVDSFTDSIKALTKFRNQMKEHNTHG